MKTTGIVRNVDELGRVVVPKELRRQMGIANGDAVEIFGEENRIVIKRYSPVCLFCGESDETVVFKDKRICRKCLVELVGTK